ncbi:MAG: hypothetical protein RCG15_07935 [Candidatus Rickettsia vulgarisii]
MDQVPSRQHQLHDIDKQLLNNNASLNRIQRAAYLFEEVETIEQQIEIEERDQHTTSSAASKSSSIINNIFYLLKETGYALLSTIVKPFYPHNAYSPSNQTQQGKGPEGYDNEIYYDAQESVAEAVIKKYLLLLKN